MGRRAESGRVMEFFLPALSIFLHWLVFFLCPFPSLSLSLGSPRLPLFYYCIRDAPASAAAVRLLNQSILPGHHALELASRLIVVVIHFFPARTVSD